MRPSIEKRKAFVNIFQDSLGEMGFFVKNNVFYKCSKANRYAIGIEVAITGSGVLNDISLFFGSNYSPLRYEYSHLFFGGTLSSWLYLRRENNKLWEESERYSRGNDTKIFSDYLMFVLPHFVHHFGPLLEDIPSLQKYLEVEEALTEKVWNRPWLTKKAADVRTIFGYLSLGDFENALRVAREVIEYHSDSIRDVHETSRYEPRIAEPFIESETKIIQYVAALATRIDSGDVDGLMEEVATRDAQSIEVCTRFFGERRYSGS